MITSETFRYFDGEISVLSSPVHSLITRAALNCLPCRGQEFYREESKLLIAAYCGLPDINWDWYGTFFDNADEPAKVRLPDLRREWDCTEYCERNALKDVECKHFRSHEPPDTIEAVGYFVERALDEFRSGNYLDGIRRLGVAMHYLQDSGSPSHAACIRETTSHSAMEKLPEPYKILQLEYEPQILNEPKYRAFQLAEFSREKSKAIYSAYKSDKLSDVFGDILECAYESVRASADLLYTVWKLIGSDIKQKYPDIPLQVNLLENSSFHDDFAYDPEVPRGWVWCWYDLFDRKGKIGWDRKKSVEENFSICLEQSPAAGIECRIPWAKLIRVNPGQQFEASCYIRLEEATGDNYIIIYFYDCCLRKIAAVRSEGVLGNGDWREISVRATVPDDSCLLRFAMRSDSNRGIVRFSSPCLKRLL